MIQFTKLRLSGFKSFVESTELVIEPGPGDELEFAYMELEKPE